MFGRLIKTKCPKCGKEFQTLETATTGYELVNYPNNVFIGIKCPHCEENLLYSSKSTNIGCEVSSITKKFILTEKEYSNLELKSSFAIMF